MPAFKRDLQRVLAHQGYVLDSQLVIGEAVDTTEPAGRARLAAALGAGAGPPQHVGGVGAVMSALPLDLHDLPRAVDVDVDWERVGIFQWTLITGSWRKD